MFHVMQGAVHCGEFGTWRQAKDAAVAVLSRRRDRIGCGGRCGRHLPVLSRRCGGHDNLSRAVRTAGGKGAPVSGIAAVYGKEVGDRYGVNVWVVHSDGAPGVSAGGLAYEIDGEDQVPVKVLAGPDDMGVCVVRETARKRGRVGEVRQVAATLLEKR